VQFNLLFSFLFIFH